MAKSYSQDLRDRVIDAVEGEGMSRRKAARRFGVSESAAVKWLQRVRDEGVRAAFAVGGNRVPVIKPHRDLVEAALAEKPEMQNALASSYTENLEEILAAKDR